MARVRTRTKPPGGRGRTAPDAGPARGNMIFMANPSIGISTAVYRGLKAEAAIQNKSESDLLSEMILNYVSERISKRANGVIDPGRKGSSPATEGPAKKEAE